MRKTRRLLLFVLVVAAAGVAWVYDQQRARLERDAPAKPAPLAADLQSASKDWVYYKSDGDRPVFEARAKEMEQVAGNTAVVRLKGVDLRLYKKSGKSYDHVESASAIFDQAQGSMFAEGEVMITLAVPDEEAAAVTPDGKPGAEKPKPRERLLHIITSGVHFASGDGKAETEQPARFEFDLGSGQAVGASYDPQARQLNLHHDVKLDWIGRDATRPPMHVEAAGLIYREAEAKVHLLEKSHFERLTLKMDGGSAVISLEDGAIRNVEAQMARGVDIQPKRKMDFAANVLKLDLNEHSQIEHVMGEGASRVNVQTPTGTSALTADRVLMQFADNPGGNGGKSSKDTKGGDTILQDTLAQGHGEFRSRPIGNTGMERIVHADSIYSKMRPGGEDLEMVETRAPGVLDLLPIGAATGPNSQPKRHLEATRMWLNYVPGNVMDTFRAVDARTRTEKATEPGKPAPPVSITSSKDLVAHFDPKTGAMTTLEQTTDFRYEEGPQRATAERANLDQTTQRIVLTAGSGGNARAWDTSGQVTAKLITMDQTGGRLVAEGEVVSTREPETKPAPNGGSTGMLNAAEPLHGKAGRMTISDKNRVIVHEGATLQDGKPQGKALVWQGSNRIEGSKVTINRAAHTLLAEGDVTSLLTNEPKDPKGDGKAESKDAKGESKPPTLTTVRAASLDYADDTKLAHYAGGVRLTQPGLDVRSKELRAFMAPNDAVPADPKADPKAPAKTDGNGLDHMIADGQVAIVQARPGGGTRKGNSEHAEYYSADGKMILTGGDPVFVDSVKGTTRGQRLTYIGADDNLLVEGAPEKQGTSRIKRQ